MTSRESPVGQVAAACLLGGTAGWSLTAAGALAPGLAAAYGTDLTGVGLFTTAFGAAYAVCQIPAGMLVDRIGVRRAGILGLTVVCVAYLAASMTADVGAAVLCRALAGVGASLCYVSGADLARASGTGPAGQGVFGGVAAAAGGVALLVVPALGVVLGWRASWLSSAAVALAGLPALLAVPDRPAAPRRQGTIAERKGSVLRDAEVYRLAAVHAATFGLGIVLSNWTALVLRRAWGMSSPTAYGIASMILITTVVSRPLGGWIARGAPDRVRTATAVSLAAGGVATALLLLPGTHVQAVCCVLLLGLASGIPFAATFSAAQLRHPERPAAAVGLMNAHANALIMVGTPLFGAAVDAGRSAAALAVAAALWAVPLAVLPAHRDQNT